MDSDSFFMSIIIPTTHPERLNLLEQALNSINDQELDTYLFEVIVITNYGLIFNNKYDFNMKIIMTEKVNLGAKLVIGAENASANILLFLEDDDTFHPRKLSIIYSIFKNNEKLDYFKHALQLISSSGQNLYDPTFKDAKENLIIQCNQNFISNINLSNIGEFHSVLSSIAIKKFLIKRISNCLSLVNFNSDLALFLSALDFNSIIMVNCVKLTNYRVHNSGSRTFEQNIELFSKKTINYFKDVLNTSKQLFKCIENEQTISLLHEIEVRQEFESLRWQNINLNTFLINLKKYLKNTEMKKYDFRLIAINVLFYCFPTMMRSKYMNNIQKSLDLK